MLSPSMSIYYVILVDGVPQAVTSLYDRAQMYSRELSTASREAVVIPTREIAEDFDDEVPTIRECKCL